MYEYTPFHPRLDNLNHDGPQIMSPSKSYPSILYKTFSKLIFTQILKKKKNSIFKPCS